MWCLHMLLVADSSVAPAALLVYERGKALLAWFNPPLLPL
jgi:hypothetical protein